MPHSKANCPVITVLGAEVLCLEESIDQIVARFSGRGLQQGAAEQCVWSKCGLWLLES